MRSKDASLGNLPSPGRCPSVWLREQLPGVPPLPSGMHAKGQGWGRVMYIRGTTRCVDRIVQPLRGSRRGDRHLQPVARGGRSKPQAAPRGALRFGRMRRVDPSGGSVYPSARTLQRLW